MCISFKKKLTPELINLMVNFVKNQNDNPSGIWADFNSVHRSWRNLKTFLNVGLICKEDMPEEPDPSNYTDVESPASVECTVVCNSYIDANGNCAIDIMAHQLGNAKLTFKL